MIFKEKTIEKKYNKYPKSRKTIDRRVTLKSDIAEESNRIIAVFNSENNIIKINSSVLFNIALKCFYKQMEKLSDEEIIEYLKKEAIAQ